MKPNKSIVFAAALAASMLLNAGIAHSEEAKSSNVIDQRNQFLVIDQKPYWETKLEGGVGPSVGLPYLVGVEGRYGIEKGPFAAGVVASAHAPGVIGAGAYARLEYGNAFVGCQYEFLVPAVHANVSSYKEWGCGPGYKFGSEDGKPGWEVQVTYGQVDKSFKESCPSDLCKPDDRTQDAIMVRAKKLF